MKPLALDLCCGLGGWSHGLIAEGWDVIGYDIERHEYNGDKYPGQLVIQDIRTIDGRQFCGKVSLITASPPCTEFSYLAMPWSRGKAIARALRGQGDFPEGYKGSRTVAKMTELFDACVRIGREAGCPIVIENVRGAQPWIGRAKWAWGSFYLWGDVPALMPITQPRRKGRSNFHVHEQGRSSPEFNGAKHESNVRRKEELALAGIKAGDRNKGAANGEHKWTSSFAENIGFKTQGMNWSDRSIKGQDFTRVAGQQAEGVRRISEAHRSKSPAKGCGAVTEDGIKQGGISGVRVNGKGDKWFQDGAARSGSKTNARKAASAMIAKIPFRLSQWIARVYKPKHFML